MKSISLQVTIIAAFVWIGFVAAISFMEAWLKFQAPGVTLELGLGIGRIVFNALNTVEWVLAIIILLCLFLSTEVRHLFRNSFFLIPVLLIVVQTYWLLPALDSRAALRIQGTAVASSPLHFYYVVAEAIKIVCLFTFGILLFKRLRIIYQSH